MTREIDKRNFGFEVPVAASVMEALAVEMPGGEHGARLATASGMDAFTGSIRRLEVEREGDVGSIRDYARKLAASASLQSPGFAAGEAQFGGAAVEPAEFALPPTVGSTSAETQVLHMQQYHKGIPVFLAGRTVQIRPDKAVVTGTSVDLLGLAETELALDVVDAVRAAADYVAPGDEGEGDESGWGPAPVEPLDLGGFNPRTVANFDLAMLPTVLEGAPFEGPITASLVYFYQGPAVRLAWSIVLVFPQAAADYNVLVAAGEQEPGEILYVRNRVCNFVGSCALHPHNPQQGPKATTVMPPPAASFPVPLNPVAPSQDWLSGPDTAGNNVVAVDESGARLAGTASGDTISFSPSGLIEDATAHTFHYCNLMHDFFHALGFDEAAGNFQAVNHNGAPGGGDPVNAIVFDHAFDGVASMQTPPDGRSPTMRMGRWQTSDRHSGLDTDVVFHEFVHGVSNRLVGGRLDQFSLQDPQSRGMGEGWSDYFALTFQNALRSTEKTVTGDYIKGVAGGIRRFPYDDDYPEGFGDVAGLRSPHQIGEIWCAALMKATRGLAAALGDRQRALALCWQIVVDGLKLTPANPGFLDARDAIMDALDDLERNGALGPGEKSTARRVLWETFASYGMGVNAASQGAQLLGIVANDDLPSDL